MSGKAEIKDQVWHPFFGDCVLAADKGELDGRNNGIPRLSTSGTNCAALQTITAAIDDTGVRMHSLSYTPGMSGETLVDTVMAPVKRFFAEYPHGETYVMRLDIGIFMPEPKRATQIDHTRTIIAKMERENIPPINWRVGEPVPAMIEFDTPLPQWDAVRADRALFRHACTQLMELIQRTYKPPRGCRVILDYNVRCTTSGVGSLAEWMVESDERVQCSPLARCTIEAARRRFARQANWHAEADRLVSALAHAGHIKVAPICIETSLHDQTTYLPFVLPNAAHNCGEADVGCLFWLDALQSDKLHHTLVGTRFADADNVRLAPQPLSVAERAAMGLRLLENDPDAIMVANDAKSYLARYLTFVAEPDSLGMPSAHRAACGSALVISIDTDFLSLTLMWYAQFCEAQGAARRDYCRMHAPFLSLGELKAKRRGWLTGGADIVSTEELKKLPAPEAATVSRYAAIWDIDRLYDRVVALTQHGSELERIASFALFCATCQNDYLPGFSWLNRRFNYQAALDTGMRLVRYEAGKPIVDLGRFLEYVKCAYFLSASENGKPPARSARELTYAQMAACVAKRNPKRRAAHMPDRAELQLQYKRCQWWISMATEAWRDLGAIVDHRNWGWPERKAK